MLTGAFFDRRGYDTWAPYSVVNRNHWIFENLPKEVDTFGKSNPTNKFDGASGHETDKISEYSTVTLVARGNNPGNGGADMVIKENSSGGIIFNASSVSFTSSISRDRTIRLILYNLFKRAGTPINIKKQDIHKPQ